MSRPSGANVSDAVPEGWLRSSLGDVSVITTGWTPKRSEATYFGGDCPWVKPPDLGNSEPITSSQESLSAQGAQRVRLVPSGSTLVCCIGSLGKVGIAGVELATNQQINAVSFHDGLVDARYGFRLCQTLSSWLESQSSETTIKIVNKGRFSEAPFLLPPLAEQKRIVAKVEELLAHVNAARERLERVPAILRRFRQAVLAAAFAGRLTEDLRNSASKTARPHVAGSEDAMPGTGWPRYPASSVCSMVQSGSTPRGKPFTSMGEVPFLKVYNIVNQRVAFGYKPQFVSRDLHEKGPLRRSTVRPGDVLINIVGPPLGKVALVPDDYPEWNINQAIVAFRPGQDLSSAFLYYFLREGSEIRKIKPNYKGSPGQSNISLSQCRHFLIPVPAPEEQAEIVRRVEALFAFADEVEKKLKLATNNTVNLSQSVLGRAFAGRLVPTEAELARQDGRDYEPASVLLERIRAEREAREARAPRPKRDGGDEQASDHTAEHNYAGACSLLLIPRGCPRASVRGFLATEPLVRWTRPRRGDEASR